MIHLDLKYILMISHRFERFKRKDDYLFNFRCPICGDSSTKKNKARGYIYRKKNDMFYKCHNCEAGKTFGGLLKMVDPLLHKQYILERYSEGIAGPRANKEPEFNFKPPDFSDLLADRLIDNIMDRVDKLDPTHIAVEYCTQREIPKEQWSRLYHIDDISKISQLNPKYKDRIKSDEARLAIPFFNENGVLTAVTLRSYNSASPLRYIMVKVTEDYPTVFGLDCISKSKPVKIVEGPLDSLFLDNCIACAGTSFNKIETLDLPEDNIIIIDNQPKNKEVCSILEKYIKAGKRVVIWPDWCKALGKDINEMALSGANVEDIISNNVFQNLEAELKFIHWRKC